MRLFDETRSNRSQVPLGRSIVPYIALLLILATAGYLRFSNQNWDQGQYLHPDERFVTMVATAIQWPGSISAYFDSATSTLNPYNNNYGTFIYGTFPLFLDKLVGDLTDNNLYGNFHFASRSMSAIFDMVTILLVFLVGRRLFGVYAGLLASLLLTFTAFHIQQSHFGTFDTFVAMLCLATFYLSIRANDSARIRDYLLAGITAGLAVASKLSALPVIFMVAIPMAEALRTIGWAGTLRRPRSGSISPVLGAALSLIVAVWVFRIAQPYAFAGPSPFSFKFDERWLNDVAFWSDVQSGLADMPPGIQWANRAPIVFVLKNLVQWGFGIPLGITAVIALTYGSVSILFRRTWPSALMVALIGWPAFHLAYYGIGYIKVMRYLLPAYPFLVILAGALLVYLADWSRRTPVWQRAALTLPLVLVTAWTIFYGTAFSTIYGKTTTRVAASIWIYENIPAGSEIRTEAWDDPIPLLLPDYPMGQYVGTELNLYWDDTPDKLDQLMTSLDTADYVFQSSNRLYGSIPQIPERYPMTIAYYDYLFSGQLGFEKVAEFTTRPELFGFTFNDDWAEESFTVYDHPKVTIWKKTDAYDSADVRAKLTAALEAPEAVVVLRPIQAGKNFLMFDDEERVAQQTGGTWSEIYDRGSFINAHPVIAWYLVVQIFALSAVPLCWRIFRGLNDRGWAVSKTIGLLVVGYVAWLLPSLKLLSFGRLSVLIGVVALTALSVLSVIDRLPAMRTDLRSRLRPILFAEALFLAAFLAFVFIRSANPDLWHPDRGGEKPMEFAYFNAVLKSTHFPPYDPWFAGGYINYYYFGYVLLGTITRFTGIVPEVAFNLAVPTCFALLVLNAWSFVANVLRRLALPLQLRDGWGLMFAALTGPLLVTVVGNLDLARRLGRGEWGWGEPVTGILSLGTMGDIIRGLWRALVTPRELPSDVFWAPSRVIDGTINEFPYFTFLFADFHPHLMALPFTSAALVIALGVIASRRWDDAPEFFVREPAETLFTSPTNWLRGLNRLPFGLSVERLLLIGIAALATGVLFPLNTWDFPTYVAIIAGSFVLLELLPFRDTPDTESSHHVRPARSHHYDPNDFVPFDDEGAYEAPASAGWRFSWQAVRRTGIWVGLVVIIGRALFLPYFAHYAQPNSGFTAWWEAPTQPGLYLIIHGMLLFFAVSFLIAEIASLAPTVLTLSIPTPQGLRFRGDRREGEASFAFSVRMGTTRLAFTPLILTVAAAAVVFVLALTRDHLVFMLVGLSAMILVTAWLRRNEPAHLLLLGMALAATALSIAVEKYVLNGDIGRMNTVFKFYLQIWVLFALVAAVGLIAMVAHFRRAMAGSTFSAWAIFGMLLIAASLVYPAYATPNRLRDRYEQLPRTLDGTAYMPYGTYTEFSPNGEPFVIDIGTDQVAIRWMQDNIDGSPVILEGRAPLYHWASRVSSYTGLPTVMGWDWHQVQQRAGYNQMLEKRIADVEEIYNSPVSFEDVAPLLDRYHVQYIYIGQLERGLYSAEGLAKFEEGVLSGHLSVVFDSGDVVIYQYTPAAEVAN